MEPKELYERLEKLREIRSKGDCRDLNYHAVINSMPSFISCAELVKYHNYVRERDGKKTQ